MMPLSFARPISGMTILVATAPPGRQQRACAAWCGRFCFFSFAPFGVPVLILGTI
jgi:hypothetical protein